MIIVISLHVCKIVAACIFALFCIYFVKNRFKVRTKVRFIGVAESNGEYASKDAFWKVRALRGKGIKNLFFCNKWSLIPFIPNFVLLTRVQLIPKGYFFCKNRKIKAYTSRNIKRVAELSNEYHISTNERFVMRINSSRIKRDVPHKARKAVFEYGRSYLLIFDDDIGYALKFRERKVKKMKKAKVKQNDLL